MRTLIYLNIGKSCPLIMTLKYFEHSLSKEAPKFHYMISFALRMLYSFMQCTLIEGITAGAVKG